MRTRAFVSVIALGMLVLGSGCQTGPMKPLSVGTYQLKRKLNSFETLVMKPVPHVHRAVLAGFNDLGVKPITNLVDKLSGTVDGVFADQMDAEVVMVAVTEEMTRLKIRCGMTGDRERTASLFSAIAKHL